MSETATTSESTTATPTTASSEGDSATSTSAGSSAEGAAGGSQPSTSESTDSFAEERARLQAEARKHQSEADRLRAELEKRTPPEPATSSDPRPLTLEEMRAELRREREIGATAATLRTEFPDADPALYRDLDRYDSAEALRAAVEASDRSIKERVAPALERAVADAVAPYVEKYGAIQATPSGTEGAGAAGDPTIEEISRMSMDERDALEAKDPGVIKRVLRSQR